MSKLIIANWKMNPASLTEAASLAKESDFESIVICPPFPFLEEVGSIIKKSKLGAQDLFWNGPAGPYTGDVSAAQLKNIGVQYVIIGHSERRRLGETNEVIAQKLISVIKEDLIPILCVGETLEEKNSGQRDSVIRKQITTAIRQLSNSAIAQSASWQTNSIIYIAYEPIWSISNNPNAEVDTPENTLEVISFIKKELITYNLQLTTKFLYGGSVNSQNAEKFLSQEEISGVLVGGASLKPEEIKKITTFVF